MNNTAPMDDPPPDIDPYFFLAPHVSFTRWGVSLAASLVGLFSILGTTAEAYRDGMPRFLPLITALLAFLAISALSAALARRDDSNSKTLSQMLGHAYGSRFLIPSLVSLIGILFAGATMTLLLQASLDLWRSLVPYGPTWIPYGVVGVPLFLLAGQGLTRLSSSLVLIYAVLITSLWLIVLLVATPAVMPLDLNRLQKSALSQMTSDWPAVLLFAGALLQPAVWQRLATRVPATTRRRGAAFATFTMLMLLFLVANAIGYTAHVVLPPRVDGEWKLAPHPLIGDTAAQFDRTLPTLLGPDSPIQTMPLGGILASVSLLALLATAIAGCANQLLALGTLFIKDFYVRRIRPESHLREQILAARLLMLISLVMAFILIHTSRDDTQLCPFLLVVELGLLVAGFSLQLVPMVIDRLWIGRGSSLGGCVGLVVGVTLTTLSSPLLHVLMMRFLPATSVALEPFRAPGMAALAGLIANTLIFAFLSPRQNRV